MHYIDDFCFVCGSEAEAQEAVWKFEVICQEFGIPIKHQKDEGPAQVVEMLGVVYDMLEFTAHMPATKLKEIQAGCEKVVDGTVTQADALSLVGLQTWAAACIPQARTFIPALRHAAEASEGEFRCTRRVRLDAEWWLQAIASGMAAGMCEAHRRSRCPRIGIQWCTLGAHLRCRTPLVVPCRAR